MAATILMPQDLKQSSHTKPHFETCELAASLKEVNKIKKTEETGRKEMTSSRPRSSSLELRFGKA